MKLPHNCAAMHLSVQKHSFPDWNCPTTVPQCPFLFRNATMPLAVQKHSFPNWKRHELGRYFLKVPILKLMSVWACTYAHEWAVLKLMCQCAFHLVGVVCEEIPYYDYITIIFEVFIHTFLWVLRNVVCSPLLGRYGTRDDRFYHYHCAV